MTSISPDNGAEFSRQLTVLSPQQPRQGFAADPRARRGFSGELDDFTVEDIVEVTAIEGEDDAGGGGVERLSSDNPAGSQEQGFSGGRQSADFNGGQSGTPRSDAEIATAVYRFNDESAGRPFPLGGQLDIVG